MHRIDMTFMVEEADEGLWAERASEARLRMGLCIMRTAVGRFAAHDEGPTPLLVRVQETL